MTLAQWTRAHGTTARHWVARLGYSQRQHERGQATYATHMALVAAHNTWLTDTGWLDAWHTARGG